MTDIKIGPSGIGPVKDSVSNLKEFSNLGFEVCEIAFTYGIYIHNDKDAEEIGEHAKKLGVKLSIHAPYWINLNSSEKKKIQESKKRILDCCRIGEKLGAQVVVFHAGFYGKEKSKTYENIKKEVLEMQEELKKNKWKIRIAPETMGKINVFGSVEEISELVRETGCSFCIDFAHILARDKKVDYEKIKKLFPQKEWHCHFSGIQYTEKGERNHINLKKEQWKELFENLPKDKKIDIVCESPDRIGDCVEGLKLLKKSF